MLIADKPVMSDWAAAALTGYIPEGKELIRDYMPLQILESRNVISESINGVKTNVMRCTGVFQRADDKNENGRIYPYATLHEAIATLQPAVKARRVMGEFDHPPDAKIHMDRVSHLITRLWMDDKTCYGEIEVINDDRCPHGAQLACFLERGIQVGISSRGVGDMEITMLEGGDEAYEVQPGFAFVTFDAVAEPSVTGTELMVMEGKQRQIREAADRERKVTVEQRLIAEFGNHYTR